MTLGFKNFFTILKTAFKQWWAKDPFKESAVIAYYAIFSLPGLLVLILTFAGYFFGQEAVSGQIAGQSKPRFWIWSSRINNFNYALGFLFLHDRFLWCRIYPCLCNNERW